MVINNVFQTDIEVYNKDTKHDLDYEHFHSVQPDISQTSPMWKVTRSLLYMKENFFKAAKVIAYPHFADLLSLCEFCGRLYTDTLIHYELEALNAAVALKASTK